jgi:lysozyme
MKLDPELGQSTAPVEVAAELCRRFEGFRPRPYLCPAGVPTIGYGTTSYPDGRRVSLSDPPCDRDQAETWLQWELRQRCLSAAVRYCPVLALHPDAHAAIADFVYNLGVGRLQTSTLRRVINKGDWRAAVIQIRRWNKGGGRVLPGLVLRREAEAALLGQRPPTGTA